MELLTCNCGFQAPTTAERTLAHTRKYAHHTWAVTRPEPRSPKLSRSSLSAAFDAGEVVWEGDVLVVRA